VCTVTIIPTPGGFRLATSRAAARARPPARPPRIHATRAGTRALWPVDPAAGGTWVGVCETGLALTLLNLNLDPAPPLPAREHMTTRGAAIPALIDAPDASTAISRLRAPDLARYAPFRLVAIDADAIVVARWDRAELTVDELALAPTCLASSGRGDHLVQSRLPLFEQFLEEHGATPKMQDAFHRHAWPGRGVESVMMSREEARTVSTTVLGVGDASVEMRYRDDEGDHPPLVLPRKTPAEHAPCSGA